MTDLFSKFDPLIEQRETLLKSGLTDPFNLVMEAVESSASRVSISGSNLEKRSVILSFPSPSRKRGSRCLFPRLKRERD